MSLLNANDLVRSAMVQNKIVNLLLAMLASQIQNVQVGKGRGWRRDADKPYTLAPYSHWKAKKVRKRVRPVSQGPGQWPPCRDLASPYALP